MLPPSFEAPIEGPKRDIPALQPSGSRSSYSTGCVKRLTRFIRRIIQLPERDANSGERGTPALRLLRPTSSPFPGYGEETRTCQPLQMRRKVRDVVAERAP